MKFSRPLLINLGVLFSILIFSSAFSFSWQKQTKPSIEDDIISIAIDTAKDSSTIYAASEVFIYKSQGEINAWQKVYNIGRSGKEINKIYFTESVYVCTQDGLYKSNNFGSDWERIYSGSSDLDSDCISFARSNKILYLGTREGLFSSSDGGNIWRKSSKQFSDSVISSIIVNPQSENVVYLACEKGIFISEDYGDNWKRVYVTYRSEIPKEDYEDDDNEVSGQVLNIKTMAICPQNPDKLYIATNKGIYFSVSKGQKWEKLTNLGLSSLNINSLSCHLEDKIFIATNKGIFIFNGNFWKKLNIASPIYEFNDLAISDDKLWIAGKGGVDFIQANSNEFIEKDTNKGIIVDKKALFKGEPPIEEVQKAAIEYAEVGMDKIYSWRRRAKLKALFPSIDVGYDKNVYGSSGGAMAVGPRGWNLDFSWEIGDLIWNDDQTSIDSRSRLTVQLRQDVLDQITSLYYERRRLLANLLTSPPGDESERIYRELEIEEITANIDGLTNNYFSKHIKQSSS